LITRLQYAVSLEDSRAELALHKTLGFKEVIAIAGGGERALVLCENSDKLTIIDQNPLQINFVKLKLYAIKNLTWRQWQQLRHGSYRNIFERWIQLRSLLRNSNPNLKSLWSKWNILLPGTLYGLATCGAIDRYYIRGSRLLSLFASKAVRNLLEAKDARASELAFNRLKSGVWWRFMLWLGSNPVSQKFIARNQGWFLNAPDGFNIGNYLTKRLDVFFTKYPLKESHLLQLIFNGRSGPGGAGAQEERPELYQIIRESTCSFEFLSSSALEFFTNQRFVRPQLVSLSNILAYIPSDQQEQLFRAVIRSLSQGSVIVIRQFITKIEIPESLRSSLKVRRDYAEQLAEVDRSFIYDFLVLEVSKP
jgi:S-adenosylmethionine:diacylglycerol 3-amino-3-carboxypropyl transferase